MFNVLSIGKSGLKANQYKMDGIADELANVTTDGYKKRTISFQELMLDQDVNVGTKSGISKTDFSPGVLTQSEGTFDMAIDGEGFFGVKDSNGNLMLTRNGAFYADAENNIRNQSGDILQIEYFTSINEWEGRDVTISENGSIKGGADNETLGRVMLYMPENLANLTAIGEGRFTLSPDENLIEQTENPALFGKIRQNFIEGSNADMTRAMTEMIITQRAYSLNASTIQSTDELMQLINDIKR
ncbi:MAG: flagellar hook basal-body protein [Gudongella sp.]|nr:flagellar hook basal-body protein [Gudongella sp.]